MCLMQRFLCVTDRWTWNVEQDKMTIDKIDEVRDSLLAAFGNEEDELLTDIAMLTTILDEVQARVHGVCFGGS